MEQSHNYNKSINQITLPDGRTLAFSQFGDPSGFPIFFFHGWPGARLQGALADGPAREMGINFIAPDRPGFGQSDFQKNRQILDWPDDVEFLADQLQAGNFGVLGLSGGAPYALACAYKIPPRLSAVSIVSGVGPSDMPEAEEAVSQGNRRLARLSATVPWLVTLLLRRTARERRLHPERAFTKLLDTLPDVDRKALSRPEVKEKAQLASTDSFHSGVKGHSWEMRLFGKQWGFQMAEIDIPVSLWHGLDDESIFPLTGEMQAKALPHCNAKFLSNEGHYSLYINHIGEILQDMLG